MPSLDGGLIKYSSLVEDEDSPYVGLVDPKKLLESPSSCSVVSVVASNLNSNATCVAQIEALVEFETDVDVDCGVFIDQSAEKPSATGGVVLEEMVVVLYNGVAVGSGHAHFSTVRIHAALSRWY